MKPVKTYEQFKAELNESKEMNEGIKDVVMGVLKKIGKFFKGIGSRFLNACITQSKGDLPECITIIPSKADIGVLKDNGENVKRPALSSLHTNESVKIDENSQDAVEKFISSLNEEKIYLHGSDESGVENVDGAGFQQLLNVATNAVLDGEYVAPLLFWGAPGIGKSAIVEAVAKEFAFSETDMRLIKVDLLTMNPEDLFLPFLHKGDVDAKEAVKSGRAPADWLPVYHVKEGAAGNDNANGIIKDKDGNIIKEGGILFFDEIFRAKPSVRDALLTLLDKQRRIGQYKLGDKWVIVAAANRREDEPAGEAEKSNAFSDRFQHYNYTPRFSDWEKWATSPGSPRRDKSGAITSKANIRPEIVQFVKWWDRETEDAEHGKYFYDFDTERDVNANPRAWEKASKALDQMENYLAKASKDPENFEMDNASIVRAVAGAVGKEPAANFMNFLSMLKSVSLEEIEEIYKDGDKAITLEKFGTRLKGESSTDVTMKKISFLMTLAMAKAGKVLTTDEIKSLCIWLTKEENKDNKLISTFLTAFIDGAHPYLRTASMTADDIAALKAKGDANVDNKVAAKKFFYTAPECQKMFKMYAKLFGAE